MAEDAEFVDLTLRIQADIFIDLVADFARVNHTAAAEKIRNIEEKIARDLTERAIDLGARRLSAKGIAQVAGYLADTIEEAKQKMVEGENTLRPANGGILAHILKFLVVLKQRVAKPHFASGPIVSAFQTAYGSLPTGTELALAVEQLRLVPPSANSGAILRRVLGIFDRQTHPTFLTARFGPQDLHFIDLGDFQLGLDLADRAVSRGITDIRSYEPHLSDFFREQIKSGMVVADVGANIGFFSMLAATLVGQTGQVMAFEPNSENCRLILLSVEKNQFRNVELYPIALSNKRGRVYFSTHIGSNGGLLPDTSQILASTSCNVVPCDRLDNIVTGKVDFIKADIEGAEYLALLGGEMVLRRDRPVVTTEFSQEMLSRVSGISGRDFLHWMTGFDYRIILLDRNSTARQEITNIDDFLSTWGDPCRIEDLAFLPN
jgi:FkbM family methyltransferase